MTDTSDVMAPQTYSIDDRNEHDQSTSSKEDMDVNQVRWMEEQRAAIVQDVIQTLKSSGMLSPTKKSPIRRRPHEFDTMQLEKNIKNLAMHSLHDAGLEFPHVARPSSSMALTLSKAQSCDLPRSKEIVVPQKEWSVGYARPISESWSSERKPRLRQAKANQMNADTYQMKKKLEKESRKASSSKLRLGIETERATGLVTRRMSEKTRAVLLKSQQFLDQTKDYRNGTPSLNASKHDGVEDDGQTRSTSSAQQSPVRTKARTPMRKKSYTRSQSELEPIKSSRDEIQIQESVPQQETDTLRSQSAQFDSEMLIPPSSAPTNETEWENELARQILTIYATSVKAKENASNLSREGARITPMSNNSSSPERLKNKKLQVSCSLPVLMPSRRTKPSTPSVRYSWAPSHRTQDGSVLVTVPKIPRPVWLVGSGAVLSVWCAIADGFSDLQQDSKSPKRSSKHSTKPPTICNHEFCERMRGLEAAQRFAQYVTEVEALLISLVRAQGADDFSAKLWRQLIVTCNAFASRCISYKRFTDALTLVRHAEKLIDSTVLVDKKTRRELRAFLFDTYAFYYFSRRKAQAGLEYIMKAQGLHAQDSQWQHVAKCHLHASTLLSVLGRHKEAMYSLMQVLEMVEDSTLDADTRIKSEVADESLHIGATGADSAQKLCLVAVTYNNLAVERLHMRDFEAAHVASDNAKKLAKLCLSYSNRWLTQFEATSKCVALAIATLMDEVNKVTNE